MAVVPTLAQQKSLVLRQEISELEEVVDRVVMPSLRNLGLHEAKKGGAGPLVAGTNLVASSAGNWSFSSMKDDPIWGAVESGKLPEYPVPEENLKVIDRLVEGGFADMRLYSAHELAPEHYRLLNPGRPIPLEFVAPAEPSALAPVRRALAVAKSRSSQTALATRRAGYLLSRKTAEIAPVVGRDMIGLGRAVARAGFAAGKVLLPVAAAVGITAVALPLALVGALAAGAVSVASVDPALIGVVSLTSRPIPGETTVYYILLTRWDWPVAR